MVSVKVFTISPLTWLESVKLVIFTSPSQILTYFPTSAERNAGSPAVSVVVAPFGSFLLDRSVVFGLPRRSHWPEGIALVFGKASRMSAFTTVPEVTVWITQR